MGKKQFPALFKSRKPPLGQHFLVSRRVREEFYHALCLQPGEWVLEIGAGTGLLTAGLLQRGARVVAVEKDSRLIPRLRQRLSPWSGQYQILRADILDLDWPQLLKKKKIEQVVGSLPYQITSPCLHLLMQHGKLIKTGTFIIQNEVASKFIYQPGRGNYWSLLTAPYWQVKLGKRKISPFAFAPPPRVFSRLIILQRRKNPSWPWEKWPQWQKFLRRAFHQPRKMLRHQFPLPWLEKSGISLQQRAQELTPRQWKALFRLFLASSASVAEKKLLRQTLENNLVKQEN